MSRRLVEDCANKPRKHLGSQLYTTSISLPPASDTYMTTKLKFSSKMHPIPVFPGKENCTYTVRVPRWYLAPGSPDAPSYLEEICRRRQLWGADVYTDDSDVVAAAVHSGWLKGDFGGFNADLRDIESEPDELPETTSTILTTRPRRPVTAPPDLDAHITVLLLPPLGEYKSAVQHHVWSREWGGAHDGMSFMIFEVAFVDEGAGSRGVERSGRARKGRLRVEEARRREAAGGLVLFASGKGVGVGA